MNKYLAQVKKYKNTTFQLIKDILFTLLLALIAFFAFSFDDVDTFSIILGLVFACFVVFIGIKINLNNYKKKNLFNKKTPDYYVEYKENSEYMLVKGKNVLTKDIISISYRKLFKSELPNEITYVEGSIPMPVFKFEEKLYKNVEKSSVAFRKKMLDKSNIGNITINLKESKIILERVDNVEEVTENLKSLISKYSGGKNE